MASKTKATEHKRQAKAKKMGQKRKAAARNHGTTKSAAVLFGDKAPVTKSSSR